MFLQLALSGTCGSRPRVINVDGHLAYARRCHCRPSPYLNNIIEQDHQVHQKADRGESWLSVSRGAWRTIKGYEAMHLIRKGQIRWLPKGDAVGQRQFIHTLFGIAA
jgi:transposase, IS6 family